MQTTKSLSLRLALVLMLLVGLVLFQFGEVRPVAAQSAQTPKPTPVSWLTTQQHTDGGFGDNGKSSPGTTADAILAFTAARVDVNTVKKDGKTPLDYLASSAAGYAKGAGQAGKLVLAVKAAGGDPTNFGGLNLIDVIQKDFNANTGQYGQSLFEDLLAVLGLLKSGGVTIAPKAYEYLLNAQLADGSWSYTGETKPKSGDSNTTGLALQTLAAAGKADESVVNQALSYFASVAVPDGGYAYNVPEGAPLVADSNSTAYVVQGLLAVNKNPAASQFGSPLLALEKFRNPSGAYSYNRTDFDGDNLFATVQVLPAIEQLYFPFDRSTPSGVAGLRKAAVEAEPLTGADYFKETGHNLSGKLRDYWYANGGVTQFGYPLTEQFQEYNLSDGQTYTVQYFQRNRFELHPEKAGTPFEVELGLLGVIQTAKRGGEAPFQPTQNNGGAYFPPTGQTALPLFADYWAKNGGLSVYGYPISSPFQEVNFADGQTYTVQYFERARFEQHPEKAGTPFEVQLGLLGSIALYGQKSER